MATDAVERRTREQSAELAEILQTGPFNVALQVAIGYSGLTLARLEYHLEQRGCRIGRSTLSYWQQGRRRPERADSLEALAVLEELLVLPEKSLSSLLGPKRPRGRWIGHRPGGLSWAEMWAMNDDIKRLVAIDSRRQNDRLRDISMSEQLTVGHDRRIHFHEIRPVTQAREDGADRNLLLYNTGDDVNVDLIELTDLENCRIGRQRSLVDANFAAFELLFDRSLKESDTHLYGYRLDFTGAFRESVDPVVRGTDRPTDAREAIRGFRHPTHTYVLQVQFTAPTLPVRVFHVRSARMNGEEEDIAELTLTSNNTTHIAVQNVRPGVHGIRWEWA